MRSLAPIFLAALLGAPGCALIDSFGDGDDDGPGPGPEADGGIEPIDQCDQAIMIGDVTDGAAVGPFDTCSFLFDLDLGFACSSDADTEHGMLFRFAVSRGQEYIVCASHPGISGGQFIVESEACSAVPVGECITASDANGGACHQLFLPPGVAHLYWEPGSDSCGSMGWDINPAMVMMP